MDTTTTTTTTTIAVYLENVKLSMKDSALNI